MLAYKMDHYADHPDATFEIDGVGYCYTSELNPELAHDGSKQMVWARTAEGGRGRVLRLEWPREALDGRASDQICFGECRMVVLVP